MTIKDISLRVGVSHQAIRAKISKETGRTSKEYTKDGELTPEGLQLIADLYFDGDIDALNNSSPVELSPCDNQIDNLNQIIAQLTQEKENLSLEIARLSQTLESLVSECGSLRSENQSLRENINAHAQQLINLTTAFNNNLADAHRLADQAQQLQLASIQRQRPFWRRLLGK